MPRKYPADHHLQRRIRALERALEPFATESLEWAGPELVPNRYHPWLTEPRQRVATGRASFNIGHLRRAERVRKGGFK